MAEKQITKPDDDVNNSPDSDVTFAPEKGAFARVELTFRGETFLEGEDFPLDGLSGDKIRELWVARRIGFGSRSEGMQARYKRKAITRDALRKNKSSMTIEEHVARGNQPGTYPTDGIEIPSDGLEEFRKTGVVPAELVQPYHVDPDRDRKHQRTRPEEETSTEKHLGRAATDEEVSQRKTAKANEGGASKVDGDKTESAKAKKDAESKKH